MTPPPPLPEMRSPVSRAAAGAMLAAIPVREAHSSKPAPPLPPVMDLHLEAEPNLSFAQSIWFSISVSRRSRCFRVLRLAALNSRYVLACAADVVAALPARSSKRCGDNCAQLLFSHQLGCSVDVDQHSQGRIEARLNQTSVNKEQPQFAFIGRVQHSFASRAAWRST